MNGLYYFFDYKLNSEEIAEVKEHAEALNKNFGEFMRLLSDGKTAQAAEVFVNTYENFVDIEAVFEKHIDSITTERTMASMHRVGYRRHSYAD